ncbi:hypothetical protein [Flavisolibacter nicotianae]|uniref:hypothetical protein n=1 Tax=Flavisolibacter nicotianae TaxID=2364882 RepID=UPI000EAB84F6|nr:hypothetical protein [Flavisolibacter nicotianae]
MGRMVLLFFCGLLLNHGQVLAQHRFAPIPDSAAGNLSIRVLPQNFYNQHLSFFCQKEVQLQKLTSLPVFIRAGSKDYVDYLEKKPNATWRPQ